MRLESYVVAEMLQRLEQHSTALRPYLVEVATAVNKDEYTAALEASAELHRLLDMFVATTEVLQDHVVASDGLGELGESLAELTLRARGIVVVSQLGLLRDALHDPAVHERVREWFIGRVQSIDDVAAFVREKLTNIHAIWMPYRRDQPQPAGMTNADRASVYRTVVRVAQRALCELRDEPELARFLDSGVAATDLPEIHLACKQIGTVLGLQIDVEPGRHVLPKPRRARATHSAPEKR